MTKCDKVPSWWNYLATFLAVRTLSSGPGSTGSAAKWILAPRKDLNQKSVHGIQNVFSSHLANTSFSIQNCCMSSPNKPDCTGKNTHCTWQTSGAATHRCLHLFLFSIFHFTCYTHPAARFYGLGSALEGTRLLFPGSNPKERL